MVSVVNLLFQITIKLIPLKKYSFCNKVPAVVNLFIAELTVDVTFRYKNSIFIKKLHRMAKLKMQKEQRKKLNFLHEINRYY